MLPFRMQETTPGSEVSSHPPYPTLYVLIIFPPPVSLTFYHTCLLPYITYPRVFLLSAYPVCLLLASFSLFIFVGALFLLCLLLVYFFNFFFCKCSSFLLFILSFPPGFLSFVSTFSATCISVGRFCGSLVSPLVLLSLFAPAKFKPAPCKHRHPVYLILLATRF